MRWLLAQAATLGISVPELVVGLGAILAAVVGPLVAALVKMSTSKDDANRTHIADKQAQADAHRAERADFLKLLREERERNERQGEARARDAAEATRTVAEVSLASLRLADGVRHDVENALTTPPEERSPPPQPRESRPGPPPQGLFESGAPLTRRGRRNSNG